MLAGAALIGAAVVGNAMEQPKLTSASPPGFAFVLVGALMLFSGRPLAPIVGPFDFVEWFENLPTRERLKYFVATGIGFALGILLLLYLCDWDIWKLLQ